MFSKLFSKLAIRLLEPQSDIDTECVVIEKNTFLKFSQCLKSYSHVVSEAGFWFSLDLRPVHPGAPNR